MGVGHRPVSAGVDIDYSDVTRGMAQLSAALPHDAAKVGLAYANVTAGRIRSRVPHRSGRLAGTVRAVAEPAGAAVTYGGGLPYAGYIEGRSHAVAGGLAGAQTGYYTAMFTAAKTEVGRL